VDKDGNTVVGKAKVGTEEHAVVGEAEAGVEGHAAIVSEVEEEPV
jgi:hypothetical protein